MNPCMYLYDSNSILSPPFCVTSLRQLKHFQFALWRTCLVWDVVVHYNFVNRGYIK